MQALKAKFGEIEVESYKDGLYDNATEEWHMPYDPGEIEREERNSLIIALQCFNYTAKYRGFSNIHSIHTARPERSLQ